MPPLSHTCPMKKGVLYISKLPVKSLRFRIVSSVVIIVLLLVLLIFINNLYAINTIRSQVYESHKITLQMYQNQINNGFNDVETYLLSLAYNDGDIVTLENPPRPLDWYTAISREQKKLSQAIPSYSVIDGIFIYASSYEAIWIDAIQTSVTNTRRVKVKEHIVPLLENDAVFTEENKGNWFAAEIGNSYYFFRVIKIRGTYIGAWVNMESITGPVTGMGENIAQVFYCGQDGLPYQHSLAAGGLWVDVVATARHYTLMDDVNRYLLIAQPSGQSHYLVAMVPDNNILEGLEDFWPALMIVGGGVLVVLAVLILMMRHFMIKPLDQLTLAIGDLADGNLDARVEERELCDEFVEINAAFNKMVGEIKELKINVYEEKLSKQKSQLLYLQQQTTPHTYINCLNTIYGLASTGQNDLVQQMALDLSRHLRYTLEGHLVVPLLKEVEHINNYIELTKIRFPDSVDCFISIEAAALDALVPPLVIHTFVENTIKYEVVVGEKTAIYIRGHVEGKDVYLTFWDTGEGYPPEILEKLQSGSWKSDGDGKQIGLYNLTQRLPLVFGEGRTKIAFCNRPGAGAQIDIIIPYITESQWEDR